MKIFKIPNIDDIKNKYVILFTKDYDFLGFVHYDKVYAMYEVIHGDQTESYDDITEFWENITADVVGILTPEEISDVFKNMLMPKI